MIHAWHLLWIVPLAACFGLLVGCMLSAAAREDERMEKERRKKDGGAYADSAGNQDIH